MLRRCIESWDLSFHKHDRNRVSLPFEWGLEHVGVVPNGRPLANLRDFASSALLDSSSFFHAAPTRNHDFDGDILKFSSAVETPYAENNTVWGRFFDGGRELAVIVLPQWNCGWNGHVSLCRFLQRAGISSLRLSMPYHHFRKPSHLRRAEYMVSPNIGRTISAVRQAVLDARRAANWLVEQGYRRLAILGTSVGSCIAFLTFSHDDRFSAGVFIHVSGFFADVVWRGLSTQHVRQSLDGWIELDELRYLWSPISPFPYIKRLRGSDRRMLFLAGRYDPTFLPELSQQAIDELDRHHLPFTLSWLPCGHYTMGQFPFNAVAGWKIARFLAGVKLLPIRKSCTLAL
jgi:hypothetical protein